MPGLRQRERPHLGDLVDPKKRRREAARRGQEQGKSVMRPVQDQEADKGNERQRADALGAPPAARGGLNRLGGFRPGADPGTSSRMSASPRGSPARTRAWTGMKCLPRVSF